MSLIWESVHKILIEVDKNIWEKIALLFGGFGFVLLGYVTADYRMFRCKGIEIKGDLAEWIGEILIVVGILCIFVLLWVVFFL